jgi:hypothetical protein
MNVATQLQQIRFFVHQDRFVSSLKQMPDALMATVEDLGIHTV